MNKTHGLPELRGPPLSKQILKQALDTTLTNVIEGKNIGHDRTSTVSVQLLANGRRLAYADVRAFLEYELGAHALRARPQTLEEFDRYLMAGQFAGRHSPQPLTYAGVRVYGVQRQGNYWVVGGTERA